MGFETLKEIIKANKEQLIKDEQGELTICPYCIWELQENSKGEKSCEMCGRIYR